MSWKEPQGVSSGAGGGGGGVPPPRREVRTRGVEHPPRLGRARTWSATRGCVASMTAWNLCPNFIAALVRAPRRDANPARRAREEKCAPRASRGAGGRRAERNNSVHRG